MPTDYDDEGINIFERVFECPDCEKEVETHNQMHLPHTEIGFCFNQDVPDGRIIETWKKDELTDDVLQGLSWTQFAIQRCQHFQK
ncbi:MAG: hypothetical protein K9H48_07790 [Melioribacteraceae bacterium]|nr:hypothetical protein [Melioribacteraceae bacterium]